MRVSGNRGASGIDGVVSAAAGFAAGLERPVTLLIGDVSFSHDSNGLLLLRDQNALPPLVVVLVNNEGGGIFSFLPVASMLPEVRSNVPCSGPVWPQEAEQDQNA